MRFDNDPAFKLRAQQSVVLLQVNDILSLPSTCEILGNLILTYIYALIFISEWGYQVSQGMATNL